MCSVNSSLTTDTGRCEIKFSEVIVSMRFFKTRLVSRNNDKTWEFYIYVYRSIYDLLILLFHSRSMIYPSYVISGQERL